MKHKKLFSLLLMALPVAVWAQTLNNAQLTPTVMPNADQTIVRNWDDRYVVSYHVNASGRYCSCTDYSDFYSLYSMLNSPALYSIAIPSDYNINDMKIVDDMVFFCGFKRSGSPGAYVFDGIVGWFDLNTFLSGTFSPTIWSVNCVMNLDKLVAYRTNTGHKVVAVGIYNNHPAPPYMSPSNSVIVEIDDVTGTTPTCNYVVIDHDLPNNESIFDVVYTGRDVVFVGIIKTSSSRLYHVRIMDNPANLPASSSGDYIHYFAGASPNTEVNGDACTALIDENTIALTYVYHDMAYNTDETRLRVIDLSTSTPSNINSQFFLKDQKEEPLEMIYSPSEETLVLLQNVKYIIDDHPQFVFLNPYSTTSYNADLVFFKHGELFNSLDLYNENSFVSVGNKNDTYLQVISSQILSPCPELGSVKVDGLLNDNTFSVFEPLPWTTCPLIFSRYSWPNNNDTWSADCSNY